MTRNEFIIKAVRTGLIAVLGFIGLALGGRAVHGNNCSQCTLKDKCTGLDECSLSEANSLKPKR